MWEPQSILDKIDNPSTLKDDFSSSAEVYPILYQ